MATADERKKLLRKYANTLLASGTCETFDYSQSKEEARFK